MERKDLENILSDKLRVMGFKKKGCNWTKSEISLTKIVFLQKLNYGNFFMLIMDLLLMVLLGEI